MIAVLALATPIAVLPANAQTQVYPPHSKVSGKSLAQWADQWWKLVYETPASQFQILDPDGRFGSVGQKGPVYFLYGTFGGDVERTVTIKGEKKLFFPLINFENDPYPFGDPNAPYLNWTVDFLKAGAKANIDQTTDLGATVDGVPVTQLRYTEGGLVGNLFNHREQTNKPFSYTLPGNNTDIASFFGDPRFTGVTIKPAVSDGYWLMLEPLGKGWHTVTFSSATSFGFSLNVVYHIHVVSGDDDD